MKSSSWQWLAALLAIGVMCCITRTAQADGKIASMGIRSLDGEDELERRLSTTLRSSAGTLAGYQVSDRELSLDQMSVAYGCDEPDARCLTEIAKALSVTHLVYGTVITAGAGYDLTLNAFAIGSGRVETTVARGTSAGQLSSAQAKETLSGLLRRLFGIDPEPAAPALGRLHLTGGKAGAGVLIDGSARGVLDDAGTLRLELPAGKHAVRLDGARQSDERLALIEAGAETQLALASTPALATSPGLPRVRLDDEVPPSEHHGPSLKRVLGWTSVGLGVAFAIATVYTWVTIEKINDDSDYLAYRNAYPRANLEGGVSNVCSRAKQGELAMRDPTQATLEASARDLCDQASTLETLQYVFIAGTVVGSGVGTYLLLSSRHEPKRASVRLSPRLGAQTAGLAATVSF
jgi:hypothetical protein